MLKQNMAEFDYWVRKRNIEIKNMEGPDEMYRLSEQLQKIID